MFSFWKARFTQRNVKAERSFIPGSLSKRVTTARADLVQRQKPGASFGSSTWMQRSKDLDYLWLLSHAHWRGAGWEVEQRGLELMAV